MCVGLMPIGCQLGVGLVAIGSYRVGLMETSVGLGSSVGLVERYRIIYYNAKIRTCIWVRFGTLFTFASATSQIKVPKLLMVSRNFTYGMFGNGLQMVHDQC